MMWLELSERLRRVRLGALVTAVETIRALSVTPLREWPALICAMAREA